MTITAHKYFRFSHTDQASGASIARQREDTNHHILSKGWIEGSEYIDEAKSATKARHRAEGGELHRFEQEAAAGLHHGSILVVERLDRLSRRGHDDTYSLIRSLGDHGVSIATVDGDQLFQAGKNIPLIDVLTVLIKAEAALEETQKKADRIRDSHKRRREAAERDGTALGKMAPPWLAIDPATKKYVTIPERAALVLRIFHMSDAGDGGPTIARKLNAEGVKPWSRSEKRKLKNWDGAGIRKLLRNEAVLGWRQSVVGHDPIKLFPEIVPVDLFQRVRAQAPIKAKMKGGTYSSASSPVGNLVAGLATCTKCGSTMYHEKKRAEGSAYVTKAGNVSTLKHSETRLICRAAHNGACTNKAAIAYYQFESALLDSALHIALDDRSFANNELLASLNHQLFDRQKELETVQNRSARLWEAWADDVTAMIPKQLAEKAEAEAKVIQKDIDALTIARAKAAGKVSEQEHFGRIEEVRSHLYDADLEVRALYRKKAQIALGSVITHIWCDENRTATVAFANGLLALQIHRGKVIAQGSAVTMFEDSRDFSALGVNDAVANAVTDRLVKSRRFVKKSS